MLRLVASNQAAVAGTSYNLVTLPPGCRLQVAAANNYTTPGQRVALYLTMLSLSKAAANAPTDLLEQSLPLLAGVQAGINEPLVFTHEGLTLAPYFNTLVAVYWNCLLGDILYLRAGIDV